MGQRERTLAYRARHPVRYSLQGALYNARRKAISKGIPFSLVYADIKKLADDSGGRCALSGLPFARTDTPGCKGPMSPSLDRIKPELGYIPTNMRVVLDCLNSAKGSGTDEDLIAICKAVAERHP